VNTGNSIFSKIRRQGDALNKPLLLLQALGNLAQGRERLILFEELQDQHKTALRLFGVGSKNPQASYAFWRLQNDGLWDVESSSNPVPRMSNTDPTATELKRTRSKGGLSVKIFEKLSSELSLIKAEFEFLLNTYFPADLHAIIRDFFCIDQERSAFRCAVIEAYQARCAISQISPKIDGLLIGLTATPIMRVELGGPLEPNNGLCLANHLAELFMVGYFTVVFQGGVFRVLLSNKATEQRGQIKGFAIRGGEPLHVPKIDNSIPRLDLLKWHKERVFIR
jgi:putative restriction endonuclease